MDGQVEEQVYSVPAMHCDHCTAAVRRELAAVSGVVAVDADLATKLVTVRGRHLRDADLVAAIGEAGYDADRVAP
jgi:copper chaperone